MFQKITSRSRSVISQVFLRAGDVLALLMLESRTFRLGTGHQYDSSIQTKATYGCGECELGRTPPTSPGAGRQ